MDKDNLDLEDMVDVVGGKMRWIDIDREVKHYMMKSPKKLYIEIERREEPEIDGYHVTIYIDKETFDEKC